VILIDDGLATGSTMRAAIRATRLRLPRAIVVAVPIGLAATCADLEREVDRCICLETPAPLQAVGLWYQDFSQVRDEDVRALLDAAQPDGTPPSASDLILAPDSPLPPFLPTKGAVR
jgi:predicted phosphoribosyltransferase